MTSAGPAVPALDEAPDAGAMRRAMGQFATGVTVITTVTGDGQPAGCTVSAFSSLSLDPPLVLVCIDRRRAMHQHLTAGSGFGVNVLRTDQRELAVRFAGRGDDRFAGLRTTPGRHGIPLIDGAIAQIQCDLHAVLDGGDHAIVVGRVRQLATREGDPLLYAQGAFLDLPPAQWEGALADAQHEWLLNAPW
ncbi:MAG: flavin reductase domain protein FMN-binding protein [Amycolatopsis sp.]|jgi:flavin reductase (DIM6/NTAB) family NADH-FMN oxidoreductase RutF|uniref:flavin reductase family protein n=1 Tax=Amycolatopsis sp. TaxID=37632 RepID=UPI0026172148|nr:flavin reductase family protein [Amycolatopsis sp.]MCU1682025.1 flavin reductase domain protein FMN-binding protein [Amycolatopsis sp.]